MIEQKDLKGNLINTYPTKTAAANCLGLNESSIRRAIKYNRTVMGRFKFNKSEAKKEKALYSPAKILMVDIETAPNRAFTFGMWKQNIYSHQVISNWFMLSWSAKWLGSDEIMGEVLTSEEVLYEDDERIVVSLWDALNDADIIVAHNGDDFDIPKINSRFLIHGLMPPAPYRQVDTLKIARKMFAFNSNRLTDLAKMFGIEGKFDTDMSLWVKCMAGNLLALMELMRYNDQDVVVLENVYLKMRPYAKGHPNLDLFVDNEHSSCPHCGYEHLEKIEGKYFYTQAVRYEIYRCLNSNCGAPSRAKQGTKFQYKKLISPIPR